MTKVKLGLRDLTVAEKVQYARQIVTDMTGNTNFTTPSPTLASVTTGAGDLETAFNTAQTARDNAKTKTATQNDKETHLDLLLSQLGHYVESTSGGNETVITSSGMQLKAHGSPIGELARVTSLSATTADNEGEIDLHWDKVSNARSYEIEKCADPISSTGWLHIGISTKSQYAALNLISGTKFWFRVAAVGAAGQGSWSDPVGKIAP